MSGRQGTWFVACSELSDPTLSLSAGGKKKPLKQPKKDKQDMDEVCIELLSMYMGVATQFP